MHSRASGVWTHAEEEEEEDDDDNGNPTSSRTTTTSRTTAVHKRRTPGVDVCVGYAVVTVLCVRPSRRHTQR